VGCLAAKLLMRSVAEVTACKRHRHRLRRTSCPGVKVLCCSTRSTVFLEANLGQQWAGMQNEAWQGWEMQARNTNCWRQGSGGSGSPAQCISQTSRPVWGA
jgi:hypothetical protein